MTYPAYPSSFQCPQIKPYAWAVDMGIVRTPMEGGNARQRRRYRTMPHAFRLEFVMPALSVGQWQSWVNAFAYDWFSINLESMWSAATGKITSPHLVRFISNLEWENVVYGWVRVRVQAELSPNQIALGGPLLPTYNWIIGGTPVDPSSGGQTVTTWNPADKNANIILSNGNLTARAGASGSQSVRATTGIGANQRRFYSFRPDSNGSDATGCGFADSSMHLSTFAGENNRAIGWYPAPRFTNGGVWFNGLQVAVSVPGSVGSVVDWAIDTYLMRAWVRVNGGLWNGSAAASPASGVGGIDISTINRPVYPVCSMQGPPGQATATFAEPFQFPMPSGFSAVASAASTWILAGVPSSPAAPDWIFAGTPQFPAAIVF